MLAVPHKWTLTVGSVPATALCLHRRQSRQNTGEYSESIPRDKRLHRRIRDLADQPQRIICPNPLL
jgi:hypothetical protein